MLLSIPIRSTVDSASPLQGSDQARLTVGKPREISLAITISIRFFEVARSKEKHRQN